MSLEKRRYSRRAVPVEIRAHGVWGSGELSFEGGDLSEGGAFLKSDLLLEKGEGLELELRFPGEELPLRVEARVAWVRALPASAEEAGMGVEFGTLDQAARVNLTLALDALG